MPVGGEVKAPNKSSLNGGRGQGRTQSLGGLGSGVGGELNINSEKAQKEYIIQCLDPKILNPTRLLLPRWAQPRSSSPKPSNASPTTKCAIATSLRSSSTTTPTRWTRKARCARLFNRPFQTSTSPPGTSTLAANARKSTASSSTVSASRRGGCAGKTACAFAATTLLITRNRSSKPAAWSTIASQGISRAYRPSCRPGNALAKNPSAKRSTASATTRG